MVVVYFKGELSKRWLTSFWVGPFLNFPSNNLTSVWMVPGTVNPND